MEHTPWQRLNELESDNERLHALLAWISAACADRRPLAVIETAISCYVQGQEGSPQAGTIYSAGGWVWRCGLCAEGGNVLTSSLAHTAMVNHIGRAHVVWRDAHTGRSDDEMEHRPTTDYGRVGYSLPLGVDPRCQGFDTEPGVIYHAHDLPRCRQEAYGVVDGRILCERHLKAWLETHPHAPNGSQGGGA